MPSKPTPTTVETLQRRNELILRCAGEGIYGLDDEGLTTFVNPAAARMLGWEAADLLGKPQHALIHYAKADGSDYAAGTCPIYLAFKDGEVHHVDNEVFWRKNGTSFPVEYVSTPIIDEDGQLAGAVVTFMDITERIQRQQTLEHALAEVKQLKQRLEAENRYLQQEIKGEYNFDEIIGDSGELKKAKHKISQVAPTDATVLLTGETGVGKELFARAIHNLSPRSERPLVKVNCATLPSNLIESELFGHEKGAFTGATAQRVGRFELASGSTIFLDEIGELPIELQAKLLRVLQEGEVERLGGTRTITVDVRVVAATNRDLASAIRNGEFREDLYYRLSVFPVHIPSLRDRREEIPQLVAHFVQKFSAKFGKTVTGIPDATRDALQRYPWPGNVRELENLVERAMILCTDGTLRMDDSLQSQPSVTGNGSTSGTLESIEKRHILGVLDQTNWRIEGDDGAATILGLHPSTLRSRMKKLGIQKKPLTD